MDNPNFYQLIKSLSINNLGLTVKKAATYFSMSKLVNAIFRCSRVLGRSIFKVHYYSTSGGFASVLFSIILGVAIIR